MHVPSVRIEPDRVQSSHCDCCHGVASTANGYVYVDEEPHAVYFLDWTEGHPERSAFLTLSMGQWGDASTGDDRSTLGLEVRRGEDGEAGFHLADTPHRKSEVLGHFVSRAHALAIGGLDDFWHVTDHIALDDPRAAAVIEWIRGDRDTAT